MPYGVTVSEAVKLIIFPRNCTRKKKGINRKKIKDFIHLKQILLTTLKHFFRQIQFQTCIHTQATTSHACMEFIHAQISD